MKTEKNVHGLLQGKIGSYGDPGNHLGSHVANLPEEYMRAVHERQAAWTDGRGVTQAEQSKDLTHASVVGGTRCGMCIPWF